MEKIQRNGKGLGYRVVGQGDQDLVLVHGWMVDGTVYDDLIEALDGDSFRLIVPDLRGAGASESCDDFELTSYVEDVIAVADDAGAQTFALVGHSMGGQIAQLLASRHPGRVDSLILLCTVPASGMELPDEADQLFANSGEDRQSQQTILEMACLELPDEARERLLDAAGQIPATCIEASYRAWTGGGFEDELAKITAPTLVVGSDDPFLPPEFLKATVVKPIANAIFVHTAGAGHYVQVERPEQTARVIEKFLVAKTTRE